MGLEELELAEGKSPHELALEELGYARDELALEELGYALEELALAVGMYSHGACVVGPALLMGSR